MALPEWSLLNSISTPMDLPKIDRACRLPDIDALLELINDGSYDDHLEAILAAAHGRKRDRRGVRRPYGV